MELIVIDEFIFEKEGKEIPYYQIVVRTDCGFQVKKCSKRFFESIGDVGVLPIMTVETLLYDERGRVVDIK